MNLAISTTEKRQVLDVTDRVQREISNTNLENGVVVATVLHTTCALTTIDSDPGIDEDFFDFLNSFVPGIKWRHPHNPEHTPAHLLASLIGPSVVIPIESGTLQLGSWQRIVLVEFDGPRERELVLSLLSSKL